MTQKIQPITAIAGIMSYMASQKQKQEEKKTPPKSPKVYRKKEMKYVQGRGYLV